MKLKLASLLDRLFPNTFCWAKLVVWAYGCGSLMNALEVQECKDDLHSKLQACYCGKFMSDQLEREITKNIEEIAKEQGVR